MYSSARAATRCLAVGCRKDLESGERHSGWLIMNVGAEHCGSRYIADSLSRICGMVGELGKSISRSWHICSRRSKAPGDSRSGNDVYSADSSAGMKSIRGKGGAGIRIIGVKCLIKVSSIWVVVNCDRRHISFSVFLINCSISVYAV